MFLDLKDLSVDELQEKMNQLYQRLGQMQTSGHASSIMAEQCRTWINQISLELEERLTEMEESGTVTIIGEDSDEANLIDERNKKDGQR